MTQDLTTAPVLSTPETHVLSEDLPELSRHPAENLSDDQIWNRYEISRTIEEIKQHRWRRIALQFPDHMLPHSARVYQFLARGLEAPSRSSVNDDSPAQDGITTPPASDLSQLSIQDTKPVKLTILGDTSYGSCCVDEIAAEHVDADAVVHYGRACLSPTARLPVLHIFTRMELDHEVVMDFIRRHFPDMDAKVILTADVSYAHHVRPISQLLESAGYTNKFAASIIHDPSSSIPNRTVPDAVKADPSSLSEWHLVHISDPPTSLLLTLISRMSSIKIFPTDSDIQSSTAIDRPTQMLLRRRYALVTSLTTISTWGILINTLSVKNYLSILTHIQRLIAEAGKKSYLLVVGKLNAAKIANFSEIGGWVVIGCWESSLIDSKEFYRPIITPFELELVLKRDDERVWTGQWRGDFQGVLVDAAAAGREEESNKDLPDSSGGNVIGSANGTDQDPSSSHDPSEESESEPPEFDLRTGRYVSRTRPMNNTRIAGRPQGPGSSTALAKRSKGDMITAINGISSPAAEYLSQKRTWRGLGTDFEVKYEEAEDGHDDGMVGGSAIEEGRTGVARGYTVGESSKA